MKVVAVLSDISCPPREGLDQQSLLLLQELTRQGVELELYAFSRRPAELDTVRLAAEYGIRLAAPPLRLRGPLLLGGYRHRLLPDWLLPRETRALLVVMREAGVIYLEGVAAAGLWRAPNAARTAINLVDPQSRRWSLFAARATGFGARLRAAGWGALCFWFERLINHPATLWNVVSPTDAAYLVAAHGHRRTSSIPVLLPGNFAAEPKTQRHRPLRCVIFADLRQPYLRESFEWFVTEVLRPAAVPAERMVVEVLGRTEATPELLALVEGLPVRFVSWVDDYQLYLGDCDLLVLPDRVGSGLKNRAIQGMALGCPVLATATAMEGIPVTPDVHAVVNNDPAVLAQGLRRLADDAAFRSELAAAGQELARATYSAESVGAQWIAQFRQLAGEAAA